MSTQVRDSRDLIISHPVWGSDSPSCQRSSDLVTALIISHPVWGSDSPSCQRSSDLVTALCDIAGVAVKWALSEGGIASICAWGDLSVFDHLLHTGHLGATQAYREGREGRPWYECQWDLRRDTLDP